VVARIAGAGGGPSLCLASHMDVVNIGEAGKWRYDPFSAHIDDAGVMWGRGSADSKGMLAGMMAAVRAVLAAKIRLKGDLYLVAYVDDETAGHFGLRQVFKEGRLKAENLILGEATAFEIQYVFKARIWFDLETIGRSAHGAFPDRGINAIDKAYEVIQAVRSIPLTSHPKLGRDTINIGMIHGGEQVNVVAGRCRTSFDIRWGPGRTSGDIRRAIQNALDRVKGEDPELVIGDMVVTEERDPLEFATDNPLIRATRAAGKTLGREIGLGGWYSSGELYPVYTAGHIGNGLVIGPGEPWQAHAYDEHIPIRDLQEAARLYALAALNVCGVAGS
jgi:succinyl-diaminopimelate desuccinylase